MTDREEEKLLLDRLTALRETESVRILAKLLGLRLEIYKNSLVTSENDTIRGRAQECRSLLKELRFSAE